MFRKINLTYFPSAPNLPILPLPPPPPSEEFEVRRMGMLTVGSNAYNTCEKQSSTGEGIGQERFEKSGSVWAGIPRPLSSN